MSSMATVPLVSLVSAVGLLAGCGHMALRGGVRNEMTTPIIANYHYDNGGSPDGYRVPAGGALRTDKSLRQGVATLYIETLTCTVIGTPVVLTAGEDSFVAVDATGHVSPTDAGPFASLPAAKDAVPYVVCP
jgi:hypothetical protein